MSALAVKSRELRSLRLTRGTAFRMVAGGILWGVVLSGGLLALTYHACGAICFADALVTTAASIAAGIATIGPVTVLWARS